MKVNINYIEDTAIIEVRRPFIDPQGLVWDDEDEYVNFEVDKERDNFNEDWGGIGELNERIYEED